jgi:hypothetical protein
MTKKAQKTKLERPLYDYLNGNKEVLSRDGKTHNVVLLPNFSERSFITMGDLGLLTGQALLDYLKIKEEEFNGKNRG